MTNKSQKAKERRDWLRSNKICIQCGQKDVIGTFVRCADCLYKQQQYKAKYIKKHGKIDQSKQVKARKENLKSQGLCIQCGKRKIYKNSMCSECRAKALVRSRNNYTKTYAREEWREKGLCNNCGAENAKGYKVCERCLNSIRKIERPKSETWQYNNDLIFMKKELI